SSINSERPARRGPVLVAQGPRSSMLEEVDPQRAHLGIVARGDVVAAYPHESPRQPAVQPADEKLPSLGAHAWIEGSRIDERYGARPLASALAAPHGICPRQLLVFVQRQRITCSNIDDEQAAIGSIVLVDRKKERLPRGRGHVYESRRDAVMLQNHEQLAVCHQAAQTLRPHR